MANTKKNTSATKKLPHVLLSTFWFVIGFLLAGITIMSFVLIYFQNIYKEKSFPGIFVDNIYVGSKTRLDIEKIFDDKNRTIEKSSITFSYLDRTATTSAQNLEIGYNSKLIAEQTLSLGKTNNIFSNLYIVASSYINGVFLPSSYRLSQDKMLVVVEPIQNGIKKDPIDALFTVSNGRVTAFRQSSDGATIDIEELNNNLEKKVPQLVKSGKKNDINIQIPIKILKPNTTTDNANDLGIVEVIGKGNSFFQGSIPNRVFNITLATSRVNGVLIAPGETFSFNNSIGDVSKYTGYKEAYIIKDGRTILGDGGGVCQVSTTLFRALLNAGLPITERHPHSYRVGYYEQGFPPGIDATVYYPTDDLKFKNDSLNHILIQGSINPITLELTFVLYGKKDNREVSISTPVITSQSPAPEPLYQDDPTLQRGVVKQVDFAASGANVIFSRTVKKDGKVIISEKFSSNYVPWRAIFLRGTKD